MSRKPGRYYVHRVSKIGDVPVEKILDSIINSTYIHYNSYKFAFTGTILEEDYIFSFLTKYYPEDEVTIVDESTSHIEQKKQEIKNLVKAVCPFIFIPKKSIIAHLHVWNEITPENFAKIFPVLHDVKHNTMFSEIVIEPIADLEAFLNKLTKMTEISKIKSRIYPSNPHYSKYWKLLDEYLKKRNVQEMNLSEESKLGGLKTPLVEATQKILDNEDIHDIEDLNLIEISVIMATDGYGNSEIQGKIDGVEEAIFTNKSNFTFLFEKEPSHELLYKKVEKIVKRIEKERGLLSDE